MKGLPEERAVKLAEYIIENGSTVRQAAKAFSVSKSTVHKDVASKLQGINAGLYRECKKVLELNKSVRHLRGGQATKNKYEQMRMR